MKCYRAGVRLLLVLVAVVAAQSVRADSYATFQLNAECVWGSNVIPGAGVSYCVPGAPGQTLSGTFTLNQTTGAVTAWSFFSEFSGGHYESDGSYYPFTDAFNRHDVSAVSTSGTDFTIHISRRFDKIWDILPGFPFTYTYSYDLYLPFAGSPETFSGGTLITLLGPPFNEYVREDADPLEVIAAHSGAAVLVTTYTPEPSSLLLLGSGLIGFGVTVRRKLRE